MRAHEKCIAKRPPRYKLVSRMFNSGTKKRSLYEWLPNSIEMKKGASSLLSSITCKKKAWGISWSKVESVLRCKCKQANAGVIILPAMLRGTHVLFVSKGTEILILLAYATLMCKPKNEWYMCLGSEKFISI